jgi:hypothetical protein
MKLATVVRMKRIWVMHLIPWVVPLFLGMKVNHYHCYCTFVLSFTQWLPILYVQIK